MKPFTEHLRYDYPLTPDSLVLDVGAYDGKWTKEIATRYKCRVIAFEPVQEQFVNCVCENLGNEKVVVINSALHATGSFIPIGVSNNSSGMYSPSQTRTLVSVVRILPLMEIVGFVDLIKLNVEGMEYDLLEALIHSGKHRRIGNIQCQFHDNAPGAISRYDQICAALGESHEPEWDSGFIWQNWKLK